MFDFIRKNFLWQALDAGYNNHLQKTISYQLKTVQDLAIFHQLKHAKKLKVAEVGGGNSRILPFLAKHNRCFNIDGFEGKNAGPNGPVEIKGVENIVAYLGKDSSQIKSSSFDTVFSISVVEHIALEELPEFHREIVRILKPGGTFFHAIDMYIGNKPETNNLQKMAAYRSFLSTETGIEPIVTLSEVEPCFTTDMASNPDNILHGWNLYAPNLSELRQVTQSVSLLVGGKKTGESSQKRWNRLF